MKCTPCRVTFEGQRYYIAVDGQVYPTWQNIATVPGGVNTWSLGATLDRTQAQQVRREAARQRRNRNARERNQAMRDLGLTKTPYGWE